MKSLLMVQDGIFGEVIRAEGAYIHELSEFWQYYWKDPNDNDKDNLHWRMKYNMETVVTSMLLMVLVLWHNV